MKSQTIDYPRYSLFEESVENLSQYWFLGGPDASVAQDEAFSGSYSFRIRDHSDTASSIFSAPIPVNFANSLEVSFFFFTREYGVSRELFFRTFI